MAIFSPLIHSCVLFNGHRSQLRLFTNFLFAKWLCRTLFLSFLLQSIAFCRSAIESDMKQTHSLTNSHTHTHTIIRTITAYWKSAMHYFGDGIFENDRRHNSMNILCECKTLPGPHLVCIKLSNSGTLGIFVWVCEHFWSLNGLGVFQRKIEKC